MTARQLSQREYLGIKARVRALVKACGGGNAAAQVTRVRQQELSDYGNAADQQAERHMPIDIVADLEAECGMPIVTRHLAELSGHVLVEIPRNIGCSSSLDRITARTMHDFAQVFSDLGAALDDGVISAEQDQQLHADIIRAIEDLCALDHQITAEHKAKARQGASRRENDPEGTS